MRTLKHRLLNGPDEPVAPAALVEPKDLAKRRTGREGGATLVQHGRRDTVAPRGHGGRAGPGMQPALVQFADRLENGAQGGG